MDNEGDVEGEITISTHWLELLGWLLKRCFLVKGSWWIDLFGGGLPLAIPRLWWVLRLLRVELWLGGWILRWIGRRIASLLLIGSIAMRGFCTVGSHTLRIHHTNER